MIPQLAGIVDRRGLDVSRERARLAAVCGIAPQCVVVGPTVAFGFSSATLIADDVHCAIDGSLSNAAEIAAVTGRDHGLPDAQLIAAARTTLGDGLFDRLRGDFTALWCRPEQGELLLWRDHLGGQGAVVHDDGTRLTFASDVHGLLGLLDRRPPPDRSAVLRWLADGTLSGRATLYQGINRLPAGHALHVRDGAWTQRRYWRPQHRPTQATRDEVLPALRERLDVAVARSSRPGERAGLLLSGGLDSSALAGLATASGARLATYSSVFPGLPTDDESAQLDLLAAALPIDATRMSVTHPGLLRGQASHLEKWQLPLPSPNHAFQDVLCAAAAEDGATVLIDGEGGDELFGPHILLLADLLGRGRPLAAWRLARRYPGGADAPVGALARFVAQHGGRGALAPRIHRQLRSARGSASTAPPWVDAAGAKLLAETDETWGWKELDGPRWWRGHLDVMTSRIDRIGVLDQLRRRAAPHGIQARHPLLDVDLVEYVMNLPPAWSFDPRHSRPLLREAVDGLVPDAVRLRPEKSYFDGIFNVGMADDAALVRALLGDSRARIRDYVDAGALDRTVAKGTPSVHPRGPRGWADDAWNLVGMECFLRLQEDPSGQILTDLGHQGAEREVSLDRWASQDAFR